MGAGLDFAELREYQPPDDIRRIDWNVTARMNQPYVRQYTEDREVMAWFLLDLSPSMAFGALERRKESVLVDFVGLLARLLTRNGNRVGAVLYDNNVEFLIPPRVGRHQVLRLIKEIHRQQSSPGGTMTDLAKLLESSFNRIKRRSLIFLISDFICLPGWDGAMDRLNRKHDLLAVRLWDPREVDLPDVGVVLVEDSETGVQLSVDTSDRGFRQRFHEAARRREAELAQTFKRAGVDELSLSTEEDMVLAILPVRLAPQNGAAAPSLGSNRGCPSSGHGSSSRSSHCPRASTCTSVYSGSEPRTQQVSEPWDRCGKGPLR